MKVDVQKLEEHMSMRSRTKAFIAKNMGIDKATLYRKLKADGEKFTIEEVHKLVDILPLSTAEAADIFFSQ